jgi:hypothetical protein
MAVILTGGSSIFSADLQRILVIPWGMPATCARIEKSTQEVPATSQDFTRQSPRKSCAADRGDERGHPPGLKQELLCVLPNPFATFSRLESCSEFTKPNSLKICLTGTPKNHRSPPG